MVRMSKGTIKGCSTEGLLEHIDFLTNHIEFYKAEMEDTLANIERFKASDSLELVEDFKYHYNNWKKEVIDAIDEINDIKLELALR